MPDKSSIYGVNSDGEAVLRTSENAEGDPTSIYGVDSDGKACMRVSSEVTSDDPTSIYGVNDNGEACVRIDGSGGSAPVIEELNVTPSTSAQTITAPEGVNGYSPVNVSAVDSTIDVNIVAGNIKKDVSILGVTGSYEGVAPSGTKQITTNGTHDIAGYANADVNVPTTAPAHYIEKNVDGKGVLQNSAAIFVNLSGATSIGKGVLANQYSNVSFPANTSIDMSSITTISTEEACSKMFDGTRGITSVDLSSLTTVSGERSCKYMFNNCKDLTTADLSALTTVSNTEACGYMFYGCTHLTSVDVSSLTAVSGSGAIQSLFYNCSSLTSVDLSSLTTSGLPSVFAGCTSLTSVDLSSLTTTSGGSGIFAGCSSLTSIALNSLNVITGTLGGSYWAAFDTCPNIESVSFGGLKASTFASKKDQFRYLFNNTSAASAPNGCTVHFPSNFDPSDPNHTFDASTLTGYPTFGGNASYIHVAFDLPATE